MELVEVGENLQVILDVSPAQQRHLETITRDQAKSHLWMKYRAGRITASRLFQVAHTDPNKQAISLQFATQNLLNSLHQQLSMSVSMNLKL